MLAALALIGTLAPLLLMAGSRHLRQVTLARQRIDAEQLVVQIVSVGQQSGRLESMLDRLARDYDRQVNLAASRLTAVLEPVLIVLLALFVGVIAFATVIPIMEAGHVL